jgi:hypothetical protein
VRNEDVEEIQVGRLATLIHADISTYVEKEIQRIIDRMIAQYRSGDLTDPVLRGCIGEIAGLRSLMSTLRAESQRGQIKAEMNSG